MRSILSLSERDSTNNLGRYHHAGVKWIWRSLRERHKRRKRFPQVEAAPVENSPAMTWCTADLCDEYDNDCRVVEPFFRDYGGVESFWGEVRTLKVFEDNSLVRAELEKNGTGRVLVVDGGGSLRCALLGDKLAELGYANGWSGIVVYGAVRDSAVLKTIAFGVKALNTNPKKSVKRGEGQREVSLSFGGVEIQPGSYLYADSDGIILTEKNLF